MEVLSKRQIEIQDHVDNAIYDLLRSLCPSDREIAWDIEMIADIRDSIRYWLVERLNLISDMDFYPFLKI